MTDRACMVTRRLVPLFAVVLGALALGPGALADHGPAPVVTLVAPVSGATVKLTSLAKDSPTFSWRVDYPTPPGQAVIVAFEVSTDPTFTTSAATNRGCDIANPACFTSYKAVADWFRYADACIPTSRPPECATRQPGAPITFYWRVSVTWAADHPAASATGSFVGIPSPDSDGDGFLDPRDNCPSVANKDQRNSDGTRLGDACERDRTPPRLRVSAATMTRGHWGRVYFHMGDSRSGILKVEASLYYGSRRLTRLVHTVPTVRFETRYYYALLIHPSNPAGRYTVCIRVNDARGNATRRCAPVHVR
jgi:hypothetical protein